MRRVLAPLAIASFAALCGCVTTQKNPVSTTRQSGRLPGRHKGLYLHPCGVEAKTDQNHLFTLVKDGYCQKDMTLRFAQTPGGKTVLTPDIVTLKPGTPDQPDLTDKDSAVGTAIDIGTELLQRVLKDAAASK